MKSEMELRRFVKTIVKNDPKKRFGLTWVEQASGGTVGCPDLMLGWRGFYIGIELKRLIIKKDGSFKVNKNLNQIAWHMEQTRLGLNCFYLFGFELGETDHVVLSHSKLRPWKANSIKEMFDDIKMGSKAHVIYESAESLERAIEMSVRAAKIVPEYEDSLRS